MSKDGATVTVFTSMGCSHCLALKALLNRLHVPFTTIDVESQVSLYTAAALASHVDTVPLLFVGVHFIGGQSEVEACFPAPMDTEAYWAAESHDSTDTTSTDTKISRMLQRIQCSLDATADAQLLEALKNPAMNGASDTTPADGKTSSAFAAWLPLVPIPTAPSPLPLSEVIFKLRQVGPDGGVKRRTMGVLCWKRHHAFFASELVDAIVARYGVTREEALTIAAALSTLGAVVPPGATTTSTVFKDGPEEWVFGMDAVRTGAINRGFDPRKTGVTPDPHTTLSAVALSVELRKKMSELVDQLARPSDGLVEYHQMTISSAAYVEFCLMTSLLTLIDLNALNRDEKLLVYINLYNTCVLHAFALVGPASGLWTLATFFGTMGYQMGPHRYTLDDIENGLLRGNRRGVATIFGTPFGNDVAADPRLAFIVPAPVDYRIHFALNCGAKSCPPIRTFSSVDTLHEQLDVVSRAFVRGMLRFDFPSGELWVSSICKWYQVDFTPSVQEAMKRFMTPQMLEEVTAYEAFNKSTVTLRFLDYDWSNNAAPRPDES